MSDDVSDLFRQVAANMSAVVDGGYPLAVSKAVDLIYETFSSGQKLLVFGNGGSSADAQHFTAELVGRFAAERRALHAIALTTNQALLTAWSNDHSFDDVFARQIEALGSRGDVAFGISTSGRSANVVEGLRAASARGLRTIAMTGRDGGPVGGEVEIHINVPDPSTARVQEAHRTLIHAICELVEREL